MNEKTPKIRFRGFTDEWEQRKFEQVFDLSVSNNTLSRANLNYKVGNILNIHYGDILVKFNSILDVKKESIPFITEINDKDYARFLLRNGDIIFADTAEDISTGKAVELKNITRELVVSGLHTIVARPNMIFGEMYLGYYLNSTHYHDQIIKLLQGVKVLSISKKNIMQTILFSPGNLEEESKIGEILNKFDNLISLHNDAIQRQQELKKGLLQKIFPTNGVLIPQVRFSNFEENWEQRKLGDFLTIPENIKVKVKSTTDLMTVKLNLGGISLGSNRETLSLGSTTYYQRNAGQFIYGKQNFFNGSMAIIPKSLDGKATSGDVPSLDIKKINTDYLYTYISREDYWRRKEAAASGTGSKRIHESVLQGFNIEVPIDAEQQKIGAFFKLIDDTISIHQQSVLKYQAIKNSFLQKMFVS